MAIPSKDNSVQASSRTKMGLAIAASVVVGILLGSTLFASVLSGTAAGAQKQDLKISGTETIKVLGPNGKLVGQWQGADPLTYESANDLAGCLSGYEPSITPPYYFGTCSGWTNQIVAVYDAPGGTCTESSKYCSDSGAVATSYLTPNGCYVGDPNQADVVPCTGWTIEGVFPPNDFASTFCSPTCHVEDVRAGYAPSVGGNMEGVFDELCTTAYGTTGGVFDAFTNSAGVSCTLGNNAIPAIPTGGTLLVAIAYTIS